MPPMDISTIHMAEIPPRQDFGLGHLYTTGVGEIGQLGFVAESADKPTIVESVEDVKFRQVVCGCLQTWALTETGTVISFGNNDEGSLGRETQSQEVGYIPGLVQLPQACVQLAGGDSHCAALLSNGEVYAWGSFRLADLNQYVGVDFRKVERMTQIPAVVSQGLPKVLKIASGAKHLVILCEDGSVYTFGEGRAGQLGRKLPKKYRGDKRKYMLEPTKIHLVTPGSIHKGSDIWTGENTTFIQCKNSLWVFGCNNWHQCGRDDTRDIIVYPTSKNGLAFKKWKCIAGGEQHTLALDHEGVVHSFGRNLEGQCGIKEGEEALECISIPTIIPTLEDTCVKKIAAGTRTSFAVTGDGKLFVWGIREYNGLGDLEGGDYQYQPIQITDRVIVKDVDGGGQHAAMVIGFD